MKPFIILSKKRIFLSLAVTAVLIAFLLKITLLKTPEINGATKSGRIEFVKSFGFEEVRETKKEIVIPKNFNKVYDEYNSKLKKEGFDLNRYKGKKATLYTYLYDDFEVQLIVCEEKIIAATVLKDGEFKILSKNEKK